jgi:cytochrome P450
MESILNSNVKYTKELTMSWLIATFYPLKPAIPCQVELRPATEQETQFYQHSRGWFSLDRIINSIAAPVFLDFRALFNRIMRRSPDIAFAPLATTNSHLTRNPTVMKAILLQHRNDPNKGLFSHVRVITAITEVVSKIYPAITSNDIILTCDPKHTKLYRDFLNHFFSQGSIQGHFDVMKEIVQGFLLRWQKSSHAFVINQEVKLLSTAVMAQLFLGHPEPYEKISEASSQIILWLTDRVISSQSPFYQIITTLLPQMAWISPKAKEQTIKTITEAVDKAILTAYESHVNASLVKKMLEQSFSREQIQAMIITLFVAGQDNVSTSLTHAILKLAQDPDLQEEIRQAETHPLLSKHIRALLCESLRVMCPIGSIGRTTAKDTVLEIKNSSGTQVLSRTFVKKGEDFHPVPFEAANDPVLFPQPEKFDYARHLYRSSFLPHLPHLPFGYGPHQCPGWYLYYSLSSMMIWHLAVGYKISTTFKGEPKKKAGFVTRLAEDISIVLEPI